MLRRNIMALSLLISMLCFYFHGINVEAKSSIVESKKTVVMVNGEQVYTDVPPIVVQGRMLVPIRAITQSMGAIVNWDEKTKTVTVTRLNHSIYLSTSSHKALVNGEEYTLDVIPVIYKGRVFVPLRFIGESFNGTVLWSGENNTITITLPEEVAREWSYPIYLNNKALVSNMKPIVKENKVYVPLKAVLVNLDNDVDWLEEDEVMQVQLNVAELTVYVGKNYVNVDGIEIATTDAPIKYKDEVYVSIRFITEALGGTYYVEKTTKETYIYINRLRFKNEFLQKESLSIARPINVPNARLVGNRRLMVSDNPENLTPQTIPTDTATLWHDEVRSSELSVDHRVYGWHINQLGQKVMLAITIENLSSTNDIEVHSLKGTYRTSSNGWVNYDVGLPIAEAVLSGHLVPGKMSNTIVKPGKTAVIQVFELEDKHLIGFLNDFTVKKASGTGELHYKVRTVLSKTGTSLASIKSDPVKIDPIAAHPRGVWRSSQLETEIPPYTVGSGEVAYNISNGVTDHFMSISEAIFDNEHCVHNPGHYGATYKVKIPIVNPTGDVKKIRVRVSSRGGLYSGAVKVNGTVYLIPVLAPATEVANIMDYEVRNEHETIELEFMHSGGSSLPLAIDLITLE